MLKTPSMAGGVPSPVGPSPTPCGILERLGLKGGIKVSNANLKICLSVMDYIIIVVCLTTIFLSATQHLLCNADSFTDLFYTNSFRGSFAWLSKMDFMGKIVQAVLTIFSVLGVILITIRILTTMLYLSARNLWEEVAEMKEAKGAIQIGDKSIDGFFGLGGMVSSVWKGDHGSGLDALFGVILVLLPNVKRYSDAGDANGRGRPLEGIEDMTVGKYLLSIAFSTIISVFCFSMGFNGTMFQALAVTVDGLGSIADIAVSQNYQAFVTDLVNSQTGYTFTFSADKTHAGSLKQGIAKDMYGRVISKVSDPDVNVLNAIGTKISSVVKETDWLDRATKTAELETVISNDEDLAYSYLGYEMVVNGTSDASTSNDVVIPMNDLISDTGLSNEIGSEYYIHVYVSQRTDVGGRFFNFGENN